MTAHVHVRREGRRGLTRCVFVIIVPCTLIELGLLMSGLFVSDDVDLRRLTYSYGGFWPGLLDDWQPNYAAQPYLMFILYSFLHSGLVHLVLNMITLWSLGLAVADRVNCRGFILLYWASVLGGAIGYATLANGLTPMVGASGGLFGLAGGLLAWSYVDRFTAAQGLLPILQITVILVFLNLFLWWAMAGQIAWQTHLGGFVSGWIMAFLIDPRPVSGTEVEQE